MHADNILTTEELEKKVPSVFSEKPIDAVSAKYCFVPTIRVVEALSRKGWLPVEADQTRARSKESMPYKKHLVRFRNEGFEIADGILPEIVLFNSHDRTSSFYLMSGLFRLACLNGLIVYDSMFSVFVIRHRGCLDDEIYRAEAKLTAEIPLITRKVKEFNETELTLEEKMLFAITAANMRWRAGMPNIEPADLLSPNRESDRGDNLWATYNTIQENLCKGGVRGYSRKKTKRITTREIKNVSEKVRVNKSLWQIADGIRAKKQAHPCNRCAADRQPIIADQLQEVS